MLGIYVVNSALVEESWEVMVVVVATGFSCCWCWLLPIPSWQRSSKLVKCQSPNLKRSRRTASLHTAPNKCASWRSSRSGQWGRYARVSEVLHLAHLAQRGVVRRVRHNVVVVTGGSGGGKPRVHASTAEVLEERTRCNVAWAPTLSLALWTLSWCRVKKVCDLPVERNEQRVEDGVGSMPSGSWLMEFRWNQFQHLNQENAWQSSCRRATKEQSSKPFTQLEFDIGGLRACWYCILYELTRPTVNAEKFSHFLDNLEVVLAQEF